MRPGSINETVFEDVLLALSQEIQTTRGGGLARKVSMEEGRESFFKSFEDSMGGFAVEPASSTRTIESTMCLKVACLSPVNCSGGRHATLPHELLHTYRKIQARIESDVQHEFPRMSKPTGSA